jgi:hypothetical protein
MRDHHYDRILASMALSLMLAIPIGAFAQDSEERAATFNERFPAEQTSTQRSPEIPEVKRAQTVAPTTGAVRVKRPQIAGRRCAAVVPQLRKQDPTG